MTDFEYNLDYQVLFYKIHKTDVKGLDRHLKDAHGLRARKERQPIVEQFASLILLDPKDVWVPPYNSASFDVLGEPLDGLWCFDFNCGHISVNYKLMRGHYNKKYD